MYSCWYRNTKNGAIKTKRMTVNALGICLRIMCLNGSSSYPLLKDLAEAYIFAPVVASVYNTVAAVTLLAMTACDT